MRHRGEIVANKVFQSGFKITRLAQRMGKSRKTIYNWFNMANLSWETIYDIGKAINHDFSNDFPELRSPEAVHEPVVTYTLPSTIEDCQQQLNEYKERYILVMEENRALLKEIATIRSGEAISASSETRRAG